MGLEHTMLRTEVTVAKAAVPDDALGGFLALLEVATGLARCHGCCGLVAGRTDEGGLIIARGLRSDGDERRDKVA
jgi:hypothetical protein